MARVTMRISNMLLRRSTICMGQELLHFMLLVFSIHLIAMVTRSQSYSTESPGPPQCPTDVSDMMNVARTAIHEQRHRMGSTSMPQPTTQTNWFRVMDDTRLRFAIHHPVVSPMDVVLQGLRYTVHIDVVDSESTFDSVLLQSTHQGLPYGSFSSANKSMSRLPASISFCDHPRSIVWSSSYSKMFSLVFEWSPDDSSVQTTGCINITAVVRQDSQWYRKTLLLCNKEANCHRHVTSTYGTLQEKDLQQHGTVQNCSEHIFIVQFSAEYQAFLQFQFVNLLYSKIPECTKEYIEVNTFEEQRWIKNKFCGYLDYRKLARLHFASQAEAIIIRIKLVKGSNFKAVHYVLDRRKGCNDTVTSPRGTVTSPNYPGHYFPRMDCYVRICVREGERAILRLRTMNLAKQSDGSCGSDYLEIQPTLPSKVTSRRWFCGELAQYSQQYTTLFTSVDVMVHFHSDWSEEGNGFIVDYAVSTSCGEDLLRAANATVFTVKQLNSAEVSESDRWEDCFTTIHVPFGYVIDLWVVSERQPASMELETTSGASQFREVGMAMHDDDAALNNETVNCIDGFVETVELDATSLLCDLTLVTNARYVSHSNTLMVRLVRNRFQYLPKASVRYVATPTNRVQLECAYGWVPGVDHCYLLVETYLAWETAEEFCRNEKGHLASVLDAKTQVLLDAIINNSLLHDDETVFWIGGNDRMFENYFEWADGRPMSYTNWFRGWNQYNYYNVQPSDDGLSNQDCVELRRKYAYPAKGYGTTQAFFWNDRDCSVANPFICEKLKDGVVPKPYPASCNRTLTLTMTHPDDMVTSPAYPEPYPRNMDCSITVTAPLGYKVVVTFSHFVLENGPLCQYDYLEIFGIAKESHRHCGDWTNRLKLLRHESVANQMIIKFVSDFSHSYAGFMAKAHMEKKDIFCDDDWLLRYNDYCYLFVTYPTVTWQTAKQICSEKQAHLVSVGSLGEELFLEEEIAKQDTYNSGSTYWLGGQKTFGTADSWTWNDGLSFTYSAFSNSVRENRDTILDWSEDDLNRGELCLALRWRVNGQVDSQVPNNSFYWFGHRCGNSARYICKKRSLASLISNITIHGTSGNISSPNFPATYFNNLNYFVTLLGPSKSRIILRFLYLDLEFQQECLYDYVAIEQSKSGAVTRLCGPNDTKDQRVEYVSDGNEMRLTFHTDYSNAGGGFFATWTTVDVSSCPHQSVLSESGELTSINFPNRYLNSLECVTQIKLPSYVTDPQRWIWIEFHAFDVGNGNGGDIFGEICPDDYLELTFGAIKNDPSLFSTLKVCGNLTDRLQHLGMLSNSTEIKLSFFSGDQERFTGYQAKYQTLTSPEIQHVVHLNPNTSGIFHELNHPLLAPRKANYTRKLVLPIGYILHLEVVGFLAQRIRKRSLVESDPCFTWSMEAYDPYMVSRTGVSKTVFCKARNESVARKFVIRSHLNVFYLRELIDGPTENEGYFKMWHTITKDPDFNNKTFAISSGRLESCDPNPCQNQGLCQAENDRNACRCEKQYVGMFCQLTLCDQKPCVNGTCNLAVEGYACSCYRGYMGTNCDIKINPCASNPCGNRGICAVEKDNFVCKCQIWWQGPQCETKAFKFTYRPLSQRMLEEPFWLGLITVFVVLAVLGCVWCIKRKFADKLEKFISEEIERNKSQSACKANKRHSLRDQGSPLSLSPQSCPRSLLSRIGLRKHSMLSLESSGSSNYHENRSFSFDDIIKKSDSQRRLDKRCSSPAMQLDKKELLHSLVAPSPLGTKERRMSLDEFIQMSERRILERNNSTSQENCDSINEETSFDSTSSPPQRATALRRKRVNFHRTLEKIDSVSFENERDDEINLDAMLAFSSANNGLFLRPDSSDFSDGDTSMCSSTPAFPEEDNANTGLEYTTEDDVQKLQTITDMSDCSSGELDSSWTSSEHLNTVQAEVRVEVHDVPKVPSKLNATDQRSPQSEASKSVCKECLLVPPSIIAVSSPESPPKSVQQNCTMDGCFPKIVGIHSVQNNCNSPQGLKNVAKNSGTNCIPPPSFKPINKTSSTECNSTLVPDAQCLKLPPSRKILVKQETIPFGPETFDNLARKPYNSESLMNSFAPNAQLQIQPKVEMITYNVTEQSRMNKLRPPPLQIHHLPNKPSPQNLEKRDSLDFPAAPIITITSNISSCESDTDSPTKTTSRMHYLSPFDIIRQNGERSTSLSNLSSSGYSSMASPGPSRCNSNSPLFDDTSPGSRPSPTNMYRKYGQHLSPTNLSVRPVSPKHGPKGITIPKTGNLGGTTTTPAKEEMQTRVRPPLLRAVSVMRKRSDSETTDEQPEAASLPEDSNDDEGIDMDHIDFKIHRGEVTSAKDLELYMDKGKAGTTEEEKEDGNGIVRADKESTETVPELVCPAIVIQTMLQNDADRDRCWKFVRRKSFQRKLSPVSSRSESPMSDRGSAIAGLNSNSPSPGDKFSPLFFGGDQGSNPTLYRSDSDENRDDMPNAEIVHSPTSEVKSPPAMLMPGLFQVRKQVRRREKSYGNKANKSFAGKVIRPSKMTSSSSSADGVLKDDRSYKRSPKRRLRLQNSLDADASSSDSSSVGDSCKDMLLAMPDNAQNKGAYRKRLPLSRCESLPSAILQSNSNAAEETTRLSKMHLVNGHAQAHSLSAPAVERETNGASVEDMFDDASLSSLPYLNLSENLISNSVSKTFPVSAFPHDARNAASPADAEEATSQSDADLWDNDKSLQDLTSSVLTDDSGSEVSFYLGNNSLQLTEKKNLLSPAQGSPEMSVVCYSAVGSARSFSEDDDLGLT